MEPLWGSKRLPWSPLEAPIEPLGGSKRLPRQPKGASWGSKVPPNPTPTVYRLSIPLPIIHIQPGSWLDAMYGKRNA